MYLKQLDILGFKSFADRTRVELGPGVTAVVGPNGSGKSNIAEAVRWVLGEQNPRELRGSRMEDVIFGGSARRKPMGLAEVAITLNNTDGFLPIDFSEVTVTRRVDRSGGSEYLINRSACRLKDLTALLAGSGLGREAYSYVGQGRIDEILSSRSEDRRPVFEEAAGIQRFKQRKAEALRLLEQADGRLERLGDILGELSRHLEPLRQEAERAARHRGLAAELRDLEAALMARDLRSALARHRERLQKNSGLEAERSALEILAAEHRSARDGHREQLEAVEQEADSLGQAILGAGEGVERARGEVVRCRERETALAAEVSRIDQALAGLEERLTEWRRGDASGTAALAELRERLAAARETAARLTERAGDLDRARAGEAKALQEAREALLGALAEASRLRDRAAAVAREADLCEGERRRLEEEGAALAAEVARLEEERARLEERAGEAAAAAAAGREEADALAARYRDLESRAAGASERLGELRERLQAARSRLQVIREMEAAYEGYARGPRTVLQGRDRGLPAFSGVLGAVAALIQAPPELERAIEAALGAALQNLVVETADGAERAIGALKQARGGRATFLPLDAIRPNAPAPRDRELGRRTEALGWAADLVTCEPRLAPVAGHLLGRVLVARDLRGARELARAGGYRYRVVTLEGEVVHPGGPMTGGSGGEREQGILARVAEAGRLSAQVAALESDLAGAQAEVERARTAAAAAGAAWQAAREALGRREAELAQARQEAARVAQALERAAGGRAALRARAAEAASRQARAAAEAEELAAALAGAARTEAALRQKASDHEAALAARDREKAALDAELVEARVRLAALEQEERGRRQLEEARAAQGRDLERERAAHLAALERVAEERRRLAETLAAAEAEAARLAEEKCRLEAALAEAQARRQALFRAWREGEEALNRVRDEIQGVEERLRAGQVDAARLEMEARSLAEAMAGRFGLDQEAALTLADPPRPGEARERARRLRAELDAMGPVNARAEEEYRAQEERCRFLQAQRDDLHRARLDLASLCEEIDRRMARQFAATLVAVRREFQEVFVRLFNGGRADLILVDPDQPLDSGVEIVAQPPGKKLQHLSLLSGGERALTAVALMFALLRVRPAPFCILDEIDAPLDDANIRRFARFLREMAAEGIQFVVITHQKATMEAADRLLGVTMEESGSSRLVSMRLTTPSDRRPGGDPGADGAPAANAVERREAGVAAG